MYKTNVGSRGAAVSYEQGTPVEVRVGQVTDRLDGAGEERGFMN